MTCDPHPLLPVSLPLPLPTPLLALLPTLIVIICCLIIVGAIAYAAWCKWTNEEEGITIGERMKKALSFKQD